MGKVGLYPQKLSQNSKSVEKTRNEMNKQAT